MALTSFLQEDLMFVGNDNKMREAPNLMNIKLNFHTKMLIEMINISMDRKKGAKMKTTLFTCKAIERSLTTPHPRTRGK